MSTRMLTVCLSAAVLFAVAGRCFADKPADLPLNTTVIVGTGLNSDAGLSGSIVLNERTFDISRPPQLPVVVLPGGPGDHDGGGVQPADLPHRGGQVAGAAERDLGRHPLVVPAVDDVGQRERLEVAEEVCPAAAPLRS